VTARDASTADAPIMADDVRTVPANEASWDDLDAIFGSNDARRCRCQRFKVVGWFWRDTTLEERTAMLREQTSCGVPDADTTSGLVASVGYARGRGARALEAYSMITQPGNEITWGELHVGARQAFEDAGFVAVSRPTVRRVVMRIDFDRPERDCGAVDK
jgi:hypothetical protein